MYQRFGLLIDNRWVAASTGLSKPVHSPVSGLVVGDIPAAAMPDIDAALAAAQRGFERWRQVPAWERAKVLRKAADLLRDRVEDVARLMSTETGKPLAEARGETQAAADQFEWYGEEAKRIYGQT